MADEQPKAPAPAAATPAPNPTVQRAAPALVPTPAPAPAPKAVVEQQYTAATLAEMEAGRRALEKNRPIAEALDKARTAATEVKE